MANLTRNLSQLSEQIELDKMTALQDMAGGIAHEINNPLAIIAGKCSQIRRQLNTKQETLSLAGSETTPIENNLRKIEETVERISGIIIGLQNFAKSVDHCSYEYVELHDLVKQAAAMRKAKLKAAGVQFIYSGPQNIACECRREQIVHCLLNVIDNAYDAVKDKPKPWIGLQAWSEQGDVYFRITDSGPGITDPEILQNLMKPFFTTKELGKGTGLGLAMSRGILEAHSGIIWLNREAKNTEFILQLPKVAPEKIKVWR